VPENQKNTEFLALPLEMPIDYFSPDFYNSLQPRLRHCITTRKVALLPDVNRSFTRDPREKLSDAKFMEKYAGPVLARYDLVDEGEFNDADEEQWISDDEDEELVDDGEDEEEQFDDDLAGKRSALVACLSVDML
jgi:hypothetical protein